MVWSDWVSWRFQTSFQKAQFGRTYLSDRNSSFRWFLIWWEFFRITFLCACVLISLPQHPFRLTHLYPFPWQISFSDLLALQKFEDYIWSSHEWSFFIWIHRLVGRDRTCDEFPLCLHQNSPKDSTFIVASASNLPSYPWTSFLLGRCLVVTPHLH